MSGFEPGPAAFGTGAMGFGRLPNVTYRLVRVPGICVASSIAPPLFRIGDFRRRRCVAYILSGIVNGGHVVVVDCGSSPPRGGFVQRRL